MDRHEEIPKTEPAEEIIEAKIEHVSGMWLFFRKFYEKEAASIFWINLKPQKEDESTCSRFELSPNEISEIIQSLIENPGANFGATANKFAERKVFELKKNII